MIEKTKIGKYAHIMFIKAGEHHIAVIRGNKDKRKFITNYAKTSGVEKTLHLVFKDLGFNLELPENEIHAERLTQKNQLNGKEVWRWDNSPKLLDPIRLMFESNLTFEKS